MKNIILYDVEIKSDNNGVLSDFILTSEVRVFHIKSPSWTFFFRGILISKLWISKYKIKKMFSVACIYNSVPVLLNRFNYAGIHRLVYCLFNNSIRCIFYYSRECIIYVYGKWKMVMFLLFQECKSST